MVLMRLAMAAAVVALFILPSGCSGSPTKPAPIPPVTPPGAFGVSVVSASADGVPLGSLLEYTVGRLQVAGSITRPAGDKSAVRLIVGLDQSESETESFPFGKYPLGVVGEASWQGDNWTWVIEGYAPCRCPVFQTTCEVILCSKSSKGVRVTLETDLGDFVGTLPGVATVLRPK